MRRALIAIAVIVVGGCAGLLGYVSHRHMSRIVFRWNYANTRQFPNCGASLKKNCVSGFTLTDVTASQVVTSGIGPDERSYVYQAPGGVPVGYEHRFSLVANAVDATGTPVDSLPAWVTIRYPFWTSLRGMFGGSSPVER